MVSPVVGEIAREVAQTGVYKRQHKQSLNDAGYSLRSDVGTERLVFDAPDDLVIKIARDEDAIDVNYDEAAVWNASKDEDLFCAVAETGPHYTWLAMPLCEPAPQRIEEYEARLAASKWTILDLHADNIGVSKRTGALVCFDYPDAVRQ